jgi:hypothetical protein
MADAAGFDHFHAKVTLAIRHHIIHHSIPTKSDGNVGFYKSAEIVISSEK